MLSKYFLNFLCYFTKTEYRLDELKRLLDLGYEHFFRKIYFSSFVSLNRQQILATGFLFLLVLSFVKVDINIQAPFGGGGGGQNGHENGHDATEYEGEEGGEGVTEGHQNGQAGGFVVKNSIPETPRMNIIDCTIAIILSCALKKSV